MSSQTALRNFYLGARALAPFTPGVIPFGLITGVVATELGMSPGSTLGMTLLFFSGSAQLVALQLLAQGASALVIVATALIVNLRFIMYSASIAPYLHQLPRRWTWPMAYLLSDQSYAVCMGRLPSGELGRLSHYFYLGAALMLWLAWHVAVMAGVYLGASIPESWSLGFTIPLSFLALLVPAIRSHTTLAAALIGGGLAVAGHSLPYNLGLVCAALGGVVAGVLVERVHERLASVNVSENNK